MNIKEIENFINHVDKVTVKMMDQSLDYLEGEREEEPEKINLTIELEGKRISIPYSAGSFEIISRLLENEKIYYQGLKNIED